MKPKKPITWREIKDFALTLDEEQLNMEVNLIGEERGFPVQSVSILGEDNYIDDEGMNPISVYDPEDYDGLTLDEQGYTIIPGKTPYLWTDSWED